MRFKARANYHSLKVQGEAASGDEKATSLFPKILANIIGEEGIMLIKSNVDETGLFWKCMPNCTYIAKKSAPSHKVSKERITVLLGRNAAGDFKLKLLLVYLAENPGAFKCICKSQLPVIWKANKKAWVTLAVFEDWFINHFVPSVEWYCTK